jgi:HlyD family secretion protein
LNIRSTERARISRATNVLPNKAFCRRRRLKSCGTPCSSKFDCWPRPASTRLRKTRRANGPSPKWDRVLASLNQVLTLVRATTQALVVRAPTSGRLTDFRLEVGTSVKQGDHLGRIDTPERYKLSALVDEFYLSRVAPGLAGTADIGGKNVPVVLTRVNSQVKDRRFEIELEFSGETPEGLQPGQTIDTRITMGKPAPATLLQDGAFFTDTNGAWVFVLTPDGKSAERRTVILGRRGAGQIEVLSGLAEAERIIVSTYSGFGNALRLRLSE